MKKNDEKLLNMHESLNALVMKAFKSINHKMLLKENQIIKKYNITLSQFSVIRHLYHKGECQVQELINNLFTTSGNMTLILNNMKKDGLITKVTNKNDKRSVLISLTPKANGIIEQLLPDYSTLFDEILSDLSESEKQKIIEILSKFKT